MTAAADGPAPLPAEERAWPGMDVAGLRILVTGFGVSGYAIADQTMQRGARVLVVDGADTTALRERAEILEVLGVEVRLGAEHTRDLPADREIDLVVTSPGWRPDQPPRRRWATSASAQDGVQGWDCTNANMAGRRSRNEDSAPGSRTTSWDSASIAPRTSRSDSIGTGRAPECHAVNGGIPENPGVHSRPSSAWSRTIAISEELSAMSPLSPTS